MRASGDPWEKSGADRLRSLAGMIPDRFDERSLNEALTNYARPEMMDRELSKVIDRRGRELLAKASDKQAEQLLADNRKMVAGMKRDQMPPAVRDFLIERFGNEKIDYPTYNGEIVDAGMTVKELLRS